MGLSIDAPQFVYAMHPGDRVDFIYNAAPLFAPGETISDAWTLAMSPEGAALGVMIAADGEYVPRLTAGAMSIRFFLLVSPDQQQAADFAATGTRIEIIVRMVTDYVIARTFERSIIVWIHR